ncbi:MAG: hypothetical protein FWE08_07570 [Oscillospiraceae bacterium]|nr:hypothetical protein [Oscillospiraceae bacterium]
MSSLLLPLLFIGGIFIYLYKFKPSAFITARKFLVILVGLGFIGGGIAMYIYSTSIARYDFFHPDFGIRDTLSTGGIALAFAGLIVLVAYFVVQSLKKSQK